jgi:hypothetical protein
MSVTLAERLLIVQGAQSSGELAIISEPMPKELG